MLYDPKWNGELTVLGFVDWLRTQDPETTYNYVDPRDCAICRYMKEELGFKNPAISPSLGYGEGGGERRPYDPTLDQIVCGNSDVSTYRYKEIIGTYGAALKRAEAILGK